MSRPGKRLMTKHIFESQFFIYSFIKKVQSLKHDGGFWKEKYFNKAIKVVKQVVLSTYCNFDIIREWHEQHIQSHPKAIKMLH